MQAYALMTVLKLMGHEPTLIMRRHNPYRVSIVFRIKFFIKGILKIIIRHKIPPYTMILRPRRSSSGFWVLSRSQPALSGLSLR